MVDKPSLKRATENINTSLDVEQTARIKSSKRIKDLKITHKKVIDQKYFFENSEMMF